MSIDFSKKISLNCQNKQFGSKSVEQSGKIGCCNFFLHFGPNLTKVCGPRKVSHDFSERSKCPLVEKVLKNSPKLLKWLFLAMMFKAYLKKAHFVGERNATYCTLLLIVFLFAKIEA